MEAVTEVTQFLELKKLKEKKKLAGCLLKLVLRAALHHFDKETYVIKRSQIKGQRNPRNCRTENVILNFLLTDEIILNY